MFPATLCEIRVPPVRRTDALALSLTYAPCADSGRGAIVASPLPFLGGDMENNVVRAVASACAREGLPALRFDYRAVGRSREVVRGVARFDHWRRVEETGDRGAVVVDVREAWTRARRLFEPALLAGYSFGCWTALRLAEHAPRPLPLVLVAPPFGRLPLEELARHPAPVLVVVAGDDLLTPTPPDAVLRATYPHATVVNVPGADHFFRGSEPDVAGATAAFVRAHLPMCAAVREAADA